MKDWVLMLGELYWCHGNPGRWLADKSLARHYARYQSVCNARVLLLKSYPELSADRLKVVEQC